MNRLFHLILENKRNSFLIDKKDYKLFNGKSYALRNGGEITLDINSSEFLQEFEGYISNDLKFTLANNISEFLMQSKEIEDAVKIKFPSNTINAYDFILDAFAIWHISKLHNEGKDNAISFLQKVPLEYDHSQPYLYEYPKLLLKALSLINCSIDDIINTVKIIDSSENHRLYVGFYFDNVAKKNIKQTRSIYKKLTLCTDLEQVDIKIGRILSSLYRYNDSKYAFSEAQKLFDDRPISSLAFYESIPIGSKNEIFKILSVTDSIIAESLISSNLCFVYANILNSNFVDDNISRAIFNKYQILFSKGDENLKNVLVHCFTFNIRNFEAEKFDFLRIFLSTNAMQLEGIRMYFHNIKDARYFFSLYCEMVKVNALIVDTSIFEDVFRQYWNEQQENSKTILYNLLCEPNIYHRFLGVKLILSYDFCTTLNLNEVESELGQLRIIEAFVKHPHSIDKLIVSLLSLRESKYKKVKSYLQKTLCELVFEVYNQFLYDKIVSNLTSKKNDKKFLEPITKALEEYNDLQEMKSKYNDINPFENERKYMELYFSLEYENRAKMMSQIKEKSFLQSIAKTNIIVRGNAWKLDGKSEILGLHTYSHSISFDTRAFKNPEFFEFSLKHLSTEFP